MSIIRVKNISVSYSSVQKSIRAVNNVSFDVRKGAYLCIVGKNGSGKSSVVNAIMGIVPLTAGMVHFEIDRSEVSYLSQANVIPKDFPATVKEVVLCGTQKKNKAFSFYKKENYAESEYGIKLLGVENLKNRRFGELSGGQQQRVLLARAMCTKPKVLVLDEPFSGLDESIEASLYETLDKFHEKLGTTIVMVSHDLVYVKKYATDIVELDDGKVVFSGGNASWSMKG